MLFNAHHAFIKLSNLQQYHRCQSPKTCITNMIRTLGIKGRVTSGQNSNRLIQNVIVTVRLHHDILENEYD